MPHTAHTLNPVPVTLVGVDGVSLWPTAGWRTWRRPSST